MPGPGPQFVHSVKVPRHYKLAARILQSALEQGASVKSLLFQDKLKHFRTDVLYALITEAIKHNAEIDKLFESTEILKNEPRLDPWLARILAVELLYGKKSLPSASKPEQTVSSYLERFEKYSAENPGIVKKGVRRPRYVRVNTNLLTTSDAIRAFQDEEYRFIRCTSGSYNDYLEQVKSLAQYDFMQDYHVKTVFVFAPGTKLHEHQLYLENKIILQDKATAMAVHLLAPPPGSVVLDMCAAPGMKTTQLAAYLKNQGTIYAVERSEERYKILCDFVEKTGSTCVKTINKDVLEIKKGEYPDVEYILLDPSCSGSGMDLCAHNYIEDARLARLTSLQEKFLKHAMHAFPNVKRIVYSTCSLFPQENERVVTNVVNQNRVKWNVLNVKDILKEQWNNFGTGMYGSIGSRCMYARPENDLSTGFFLAIMDKDLKHTIEPESKVGNVDEEVPVTKIDNDDNKFEENHLNIPQEGKKGRKKKNKTEVPADEIQVDGETNYTNDYVELDTDMSKFKSKKGKNKKSGIIIEEFVGENESRNCNVTISSSHDESIDLIQTVNGNEGKKRKKKNKKRLFEEVDQTEKVEVSEKKKKDKCSEFAQTAVDDEHINTNEKTEEIKNNVILAEVEIIEERKEKKTKNNKSSVFVQNESKKANEIAEEKKIGAVLAADIIEERKAKKKKQKLQTCLERQNENELEENVECVDTLQQDVLIRKKKKKNKIAS